MIEEARKADADPLAKLEREIGDLRRFKLEEIADFLAERGHPNPFITEPEPIEPVTFVTLQDAWELKNTNERTRRTKRRYMTRLAEHLGHNDANRVKLEGFAAFEGVLLTQANAGEIAHKSVENILAGSRRSSLPESRPRRSRQTRLPESASRPRNLSWARRSATPSSKLG
jgi:hypothetical protein